jgi:O-antigen/teichoic acid export membrane protein
VEGKNYIITNLTLFTTILTNVAKIILLFLGMNVVLVVFSTFVISLLQAVYIVLYFRKKYKWIDLSVEPDYSALSQKNSALTHQIAGLVFQNTDVLILTAVCGLKVVSVYSMYKLVVGHLYSVINIPFNSISFWLGQTFNTDKKKFIKMIDMVEIGLSAFTFGCYSVFIALMGSFIGLYTKGIHDITYVDGKLVILFATIELLTFARLPMLNTINYAGHFKKTLPQTIIETVLNLTVSIISVFWFGIYGVLIGTAVALLYRTTDVIIYTNKKILERSPFKTFSIYAVNLMLLVVCQLLYSRVAVAIHSYVHLLLMGGILFVIAMILHFGLVLLIYREQRAVLINVLRNKLKK